MSSISNLKTVERPWRSFTIPKESAAFKIERIEDRLKSSSSLKLHNRRRGHWEILSRQAKI
jgi:mannose-6-phosphate isomerase-like protein (cupin superfamily)